MPIPSDALARALAAVALSAGAKVVLVVLGMLAVEGVYAGAAGWSRLSLATGLSPKKVQRALRELEAAGWTLRVQVGRRPSSVRLLTWTKTVQASADRSLDTSVHMDKGVRTKPARVDAKCPSEGQIRVGGEGGGASLSLDPLAVPDDLLVPPKSEPSRKRPSRSEAKSPGTAPLFAEDAVPDTHRHRKPPRVKAKRGECTSEQWARVHGAFVKGRKISGLPGWGPRDVPSNRKLVAKLLVDFELGDFEAVVARSAQEIGEGGDPRWHTLAFIARKFPERVELAATGPAPARFRSNGMAITLKPAERDPTPEELANDPQLLRALEGQQ